MALLSVYMALLSVYRALLSVYKARSDLPKTYTRVYLRYLDIQLF